MSYIICMTQFLFSMLLAASGSQTKNPADCQFIPADQQRACVQEIRAGRAYEIQNPGSSWDSGWTKPERPVTQAAATPTEERIAAAAERTARATETIGSVLIFSMCISVVSSIIMFIAVL
jgi:hypothetical protein